MVELLSRNLSFLVFFLLDTRKMLYEKNFVPLESNPDVFNKLMHDLGVSDRFEFIDIWSIEDSDQLAMVPHPVLALILVLPTSENYEQKKSEEESTRDIYKGSGDEEKVMWFQQTINNACGLYALLHAVCNIKEDKLFGECAACFKLDQSKMPQTQKFNTNTF